MALRILRSVLLLALLAGPAWGEDDPLTFQDRVVAVVRSAEGPRTITVIRLHHAKAEELAVTLEGLLPRSVTVVPDVPTNSLIVSLPAAPPLVPVDTVR
ncbi:MAG: secretin N-terminal domain-containing protein [Myxococcota bacterium]